jgi:hypothetical protein
MPYWGADKSLARPGRKQARKHVRDARDFNNIETRAVIKYFFLQGKAPKEIHAILTETLACFLPYRAKDLPGPLYSSVLLPDTLCLFCRNILFFSIMAIIPYVYPFRVIPGFAPIQHRRDSGCSFNPYVFDRLADWLYDLRLKASSMLSRCKLALNKFSQGMASAVTR